MFRALSFSMGVLRKYTMKIKNSSWSVAFSLIILISGSFLSPMPAHAAGISDVVGALWGFVSGGDSTPAASAAQVYQNPDNSQTAPLLQAAINQDPTALKNTDDVAMVNGEALVNQTGPDGSIADINNASSTQISVYTVRIGDTLSSIAQLFGVSTNTIIGANDIQGPIQPGDTLIILPISGIEYTVKSGDTIASIAKKYGADAGDIMNYNSLTSDSALTAGTVLLIPDVEGVSAGSSQATSATTPSTTKKSTTSKKSSVSKKDPLYNPVHGNVGVPDYPGYYARPIVGGVMTQGLHGYNAVDLATPSGSPISAAADGKVIIAKTGGYNGGYGNYVVIQHANNTQTLYGHMKTVIATVGEEVTQGQEIGTVGMTGLATGPHVHFEVRGAVNPFGQD